MVGPMADSASKSKYVEYIRWFNMSQVGRLRAMDGRSRIAWNLRKYRSAKGITQEALAVDAGVDRTYISGIENGSFNPAVDLLERLASALGVDISALFAVPAPGDVAPEKLRPGRKPK